MKREKNIVAHDGGWWVVGGSWGVGSEAVYGVNAVITDMLVTGRVCNEWRGWVGLGYGGGDSAMVFVWRNFF